MKLKLTLLVTLLFVTVVNAQIYTPSGAIQGVSSNNNVGIGTTTPSEKLQVLGNLRFIGNGITTSNTIISEINSYAGGLNQFRSSSIKFFTGTYVDQGKITFNTGFSGVDAERVRIEENGNVGIGTSTPSEKLQVFGNLRFVGNAITTSNTIISEINSYAGGLNQFKSSSIKFFTGTYVDQGKITFNTSASGVDVERVSIEENGSVGIGTTNPSSLLTVAGNINSREVKVTVDAGADFVFENNYNLSSLDAVDKYIKKNKHLPEIASADEMKKDGINLSEMNIKLLQKIEEITLYMIDQNKSIQELKQEMKDIKSKI